MVIFLKKTISFICFKNKNIKNKLLQIKNSSKIYLKT